MSEEQWHEWRSGGIGASDVAAAAQNLYGGAYRVVAGRLGLVATASTSAMDRGHRWEQRIADLVQIATGAHVVGEQTWCQHGDRPRHRATVDAFLADTHETTIGDVIGVLEIKTRGRGRRAPWSYYGDQVQWQMHVTGTARALVATAEVDDLDDSLIGLDLRWIDRDDDRIGDLVTIADRLLEHIDSGTLPEPDAEALDIVRDVNRHADPDADLVVMDDLEQLVARREEIRQAVKAADDEAGTIEAMILHRLGSATVGRAGRWRVKLSAPAMVLTADAEADLLAERPDLGRIVLDRNKAKADGAYGRFVQPVGARRLTITNTKKGTDND
jgi:predicted phage-related endonuclease